MNLKVFLAPTCTTGITRSQLGRRLALGQNSLVTIDENDDLVSLFEDQDQEVQLVPMTFKDFLDFSNESSTKVFNDSDVLIFIPGSFNTTALLLNAIQYARSHELEAPIVLLNEGNFFGDLIDSLKYSSFTPKALTADNISALSKQVNSKSIYVAKTIEDVLCFVEKISNYTYLSNVVNRGDYVNYPVQYENVLLDSEQSSLYHGWRVLNVSNDCVYLISAGIPLAFSFSKEQDNEEGMNQIRALFKWSFDHMPFAENGFPNKASIAENFINKYTLDVNVASFEDFENATGMAITFGIPRDIHKGLLSDPSPVYLLSWYDQLCLLEQDGTISKHKYGTYGVRFIVKLKPNILTNLSKSKKNGAWQLI